MSRIRRLGLFLDELFQQREMAETDDKKKELDEKIKEIEQVIIYLLDPNA